MFWGLRKKLAVIICLFSAALSTAIGIIGYSTYIESVTARYEDFSVAVLKLAHSHIDADDGGEVVSVHADNRCKG